ncbi:dual OB domain-containing protein [Streptomyces buecherae]|uniref:dual OB domain-containing protein n=1 Tax=Streptomyces buecherae TaxID=2763006 RepID=UPI0039F73A6B
MATTKRLVCLANSRKHGGRCVAGIDMHSSSWIRPVSGRPGRAVSTTERQYPSGAEPRPLDIVSLRLIEPRPISFHQENWLVDSSVRWQQKGRIGWDELRLLEQPPARLWSDGFHTNAGSNDRVPTDHEGVVTDSLKLIRVSDATIKVHRAWARDDPAVRAQFQHAGSEYCLKVTDPACEDTYRRRGTGSYSLGDTFLTISLSEEFNGYLYKLVAAVIERSQVEPRSRR